MLPDHPTPVPLTLTFATTLLGVLCLGSAASTAEPQCVTSFREIKFPDGSARVKNYVCQTKGTATPEIRIEFDRLSEDAAGSLIQGTPHAYLQRAFGNVRVVKNTVAAEVKKLFDQFGTKNVVSSCFAFQVASAAGGRGYQNDADSTCGQSSESTLWYLTYPNRESVATFEMPLPTAVRYYQTTSNWPQGFNFFYAGEDCLTGSPIPCTIIWRPARAEDLTNYEQNLAAYNKLLGLEDYSSKPAGVLEEAEPKVDETDSWANTQKRYFDLIAYLTRGGWPDDFLIITGTVGRGDCEGYGLALSLYVRQLILDVAFIQNVSDRAVSIDGLLGSEGAITRLRAVMPGATTIEGATVALPKEQIEPGETIAIPLVISFTMGDGLKEIFGDQRDAEKVFKRIRAAKQGMVFQVGADGSEPLIRKVRESFGRPTVPGPPTYAFGPELRLSGLVMDGKPIVFDQASRNFMRLTAFEEGASCPYLYAWDDGQNAWVRHGKIIHAANSKDKEATEKITFSGFHSKFRLAEEELEVSYIDSVRLEVRLRDGTGISLRPSVALTSSQDGRYATIRAGQTIEFSFELPPTINAAAVNQSTLAVTGYYQPYSSMMMAKH